MGCGALGSPLPRERHFNHLLASGFAANQKNKEVKRSTKKDIASFLPSSELLLVPPVRREREKIRVHKPQRTLGASILADAERPPHQLPLPATGTAGAQALARLSVIPALPRLVSAPRTQTARGSVSGFSGSPHTSAARLHAPAPVKYSGHSSLPHQYAAKSLSLSIMIWKLAKTTRSRLTKSVLPHYRGKEGERGHVGTVMQKNNLRS